jgi:polyhydroxyalkanoate synthesis regulator phasin
VLNADDTVEPSFRFPVQISPISIAAAPNTKRFYVLNFASNTITSISPDLLDPKRALSLKDLVTYRTSILNAFYDLAGGFFQYLKDCLCDHFLVNCPTCDPADKLYLAVVSIKDRQVYKVCNFSLRKHVKSFPTVEYWLSLVPVVPLFKQAIERFCCAALPGFFGKQNAPQAQVTDNQITLADNRIKSSAIRSGIQSIKTSDIRSSTIEAVTKVRSGGSLVMDVLTKGTQQQKPAPPGLQSSDIAGQAVGEAQLRLAAAKIKVVAIEPYNPNAGLTNLVEFTRAPLRLEEGAQIKLITKDDKVLYYTIVSKATVTAMAETTELRSELSALKKQMMELEQKHQDALGARDNELAALKVSARDLQVTMETINQLKEQVAKLSRKTKAPRRSKGERGAKE